VRTVLEGSVRRSGKRVRITAQLIDVTDGFHLWSERYDREIEDIFAVQDEIASAIAVKMQTALAGTASRAQRATDNIDAYGAYLRGRALLDKRGPYIAQGLVLTRSGSSCTRLNSTRATCRRWHGMACTITDCCAIDGTWR